MIIFGDQSNCRLVQKMFCSSLFFVRRPFRRISLSVECRHNWNIVLGQSCGRLQDSKGVLSDVRARLTLATSLIAFSGQSFCWLIKINNNNNNNNSYLGLLSWTYCRYFLVGLVLWVSAEQLAVTTTHLRNDLVYVRRGIVKPCSLSHWSTSFLAGRRKRQ